MWNILWNIYHIVIWLYDTVMSPIVGQSYCKIVNSSIVRMSYCRIVYCKVVRLCYCMVVRL